ncbi:F0F1 ATP synthase subunit gamma [Acidiferrimicrobium sp. IK]|uniref:F0F1 ATP synthase subunit gamma n=1 Tax=Acidiferrimicrobium sp. IK TaxID=2871700 RepID=UPI0021CAF823|nr:F0F1 ATP synthase subunit gamma [Acidiferrimicrobium sp. IK]MCU4186493.1 F0F1 ATP synthase subunit gamma [Acidiferrimicrobium sp. IK]
MAGGQERALRQRVRSNQNVRKITRAMELIAASRIAKDQQRVAAARPYAELMTTVVAHLTKAGANLDQPLLETRDPVRTVGILAITADKGLAGGYNANVTRAADQAVAAARRDGLDAKVYVAGKKGVNYFRFRHQDVAQSWTGFSELPRAEDARAIAGAIRDDFVAGEIDRLELIYTQFLSLGNQKVATRRLLPLDRSALEEIGGGSEHSGPEAAYEFEPEPEAILERLLPLYVESRVYSALLEAAASEHAARQRAMKSATDNASDLIKLYERKANRVRQEAITTELVEVTGAAAALAAGSGS